MTSKDLELPLRPCVGIMLLNSEGKVWIGRRLPKWDGDGSAQLWQMPQGGIDKDEAPRAAALRELREETGTSHAKILYESQHWYTYDLPVKVLGTALKGRYRGQTQRWFLMRFLGGDADINLDPQLGEEAEFDAWKWVDVAALPDLVVSFKQDVYKKVIAEFLPQFEGT